MIKVRLYLLLIFLVVGCSSSVSDFEDKIEASVLENNGEMTSLEIRHSRLFRCLE